MRFPEFTGEWDKYRVSDLLEFFPTNSLSWDQLEYSSGNVYNLHYGIIHKGAPTQIDIDNFQLPSIRDEFIPRTYTLCKDGDVVFADASEDTNDVAKVVEFFNCSHTNIVCGLHTIHGRDKLNVTIRGFNGYAFSASPFRNQIKQLAQGAKVYSVSQKNFNECYIGIPSEEEQIKIANLLRLIDARISTQSQIIEELKSIKRILRNNLYRQLAESGRVEKITNLLDYEQPTNYIVTDTNYSDDHSLTPVLTANKAFVLGYINEDFGVYNKGECIIFDDFTMDLKYVDFPFKVKSSAIKILTAKQGVNLRFIYEYLSFLRLTSTDHKRHYISEIEQMKIIVPKIEIQNNIANILWVLDQKIDIETKQYDSLMKQKKYLLGNMFI